MSKKILVVVGMALIIAVSGGVIALNSNHKDTNKQSASSSAIASSDENIGNDISEGSDNSSSDVITEDESTDENVTDNDENFDETQAVEAPTSYDGTVEPAVPYDEQIISDTMYIKFVVANSTGAEASPRVVFGKEYDACYIAFSPNKTFEMCVDPVSGDTRSGTYEIVNDIVSVTYDDGTGSEYDILVDEAGSITHVIVNYGDYRVYFG